MSDGSSIAKIRCEACGKSYALKPEYAGRSLKCKCGATLSVPATTAEDDSAYDVAEPASPTKCPACSGKLAPGAALCVACGFNLKTGKRMSTDVDVDDGGAAPAKPSKGAAAKGPTVARPAGAAASTAAPGRPAGKLQYAGSRGPAKPVDPHKQAEVRKIIVLSVGFVVVAIVIALAVLALKFAGKGEPEKGQDEEAKKFISEDSMKPMARWFETGPDGKMFGGYNVRQARSRYDEWKAMGVKEVWISNAMMSLVVVFELPDDPDTRKKIYDWQADWHRKQRKQPATDQGGKYLIIHIPMVNV